MSKTLRTRKDGSRVYEIRVSRGRDPDTGKQLTPYSMTWKIPENYSDKKAEREASKIEGQFIADCKAGKVLTKQEQKQRDKEIAEQKERERIEAENKPTFEKYVEVFLNRLQATGRAAGTVESYTRTLNRAAEIMGSHRITDITTLMVRKYIDDMMTNNDFKASTQTRHFAVLRLLFESAVDDGIITTSPMDRMKRPKKPKEEIMAENAKEKAYGESEVKHILECLDCEPMKWRTLITVMLDTGCRRGEICGLKWENVNLDTGEVNICNNRQYTPGKGVYDTSPKNGKSRTVFLTMPALALLKRWSREQRLELFKHGVSCKGYVFNGIYGDGMHPSHISRYFKQFGERYGIPNFHPHALRHTMATISIANGADVVSVSKKLGHSNIALTLNVYSHANEEAQRRANDVLANAIYNQNSKQA